MLHRTRSNLLRCYCITLVLLSLFISKSQCEKYLPEKGDPYCTQGETEFSTQQGDRYPCRPPATTDVGIATIEPMQNGGVQIVIYGAQNPNRPSLGQMLSFTIIAYLNETLTDYYFLLPQHQNQQQYPQNFQEGQRHGGGNGRGGQGQQRRGEQGQYRAGQGGQERWLQSTNTTTQFGEINLLYLRTQTALIYYDQNTWWWQHTLDFQCMWTEGGNDITNSSVLSDVTTSIYNQLTIGINNNAILNMSTGQDRYGITELSLELTFVAPAPPANPAPPNHPGTASPTMGETNPSDDGPLEDTAFVDYLNPNEWSTLRYVGLGLFLGTFFGTAILVFIAGRRERHRREKQFWGNLATEEGVEELLKTGWTLRGSKMEIYNKSGIGYRDDDSMLIGGYEQREAVVGAEITVTQPESVTTPDSLFR